MSLNRQKEIRAELIAQMVVASVECPKIARALNMSYRELKMLMSTPEYQAIEERIAQRTKDKAQEISDARLEKRLALRAEVEDAVGEAIHLLLAALRQKKDLRAALEILDRDPQHDFAKGSRQTEVRARTPAISSEALSSAIKDADITHKIIEAAERLGVNEKIPQA